MAKARYSYVVSIDQATQDRLSPLIKNGWKYIDLFRLGIDTAIAMQNKAKALVK